MTQFRDIHLESVLRQYVGVLCLLLYPSTQSDVMKINWNNNAFSWESYGVYLKIRVKLSVYSKLILYN